MTQSYATGRKPHVRVSQDRYLEVLDEVEGTAWLDDIAEFLNVHPSTARRKLDGLVAQGKVTVERSSMGSLVYRLVGSE
jgi:predicted ArsR family transcriptional regulator